MNKLDYRNTGIIVSFLIIIIGVVLYCVLIDRLKSYSFIFIFSGLGGLIGVMKRTILKIILLILLLCIAVITFLQYAERHFTSFSFG